MPETILFSKHLYSNPIDVGGFSVGTDANSIAFNFIIPDVEKDNYVCLEMPIYNLDPTKTYELHIEIYDGYPNEWPGQEELRLIVGENILWKYDVGERAFSGWIPVKINFKPTDKDNKIKIKLYVINNTQKGAAWGLTGPYAIRNIYLIDTITSNKIKIKIPFIENVNVFIKIWKVAIYILFLLIIPISILYLMVKVIKIHRIFNVDRIEVEKPILTVLFFLLIFSIVFSATIPTIIMYTIGKESYYDFYPMSGKGGDYVATYCVINNLMVKGKSIYTANFDDPYGRTYYSYPPLHPLFLTPLSFLSYNKSYQIWIIISIILIILSIFLISTFTKHKIISIIVLFTIYFQSTFLQFHIERGQTDILMLFFMVLFIYYYIIEKKPYICAFFFTIVSLIKVLPGIFVLFFLIRKEFKIIILSSIYAITFMLLTNPTQWLIWITKILPFYSNVYLEGGIDHSLNNLYFIFLQDHTSSLLASKITSITLIVIYIIIVYVNKQRDKYVLLEIAILTMIMEITPPWAANYKLILLIFLFLSPVFLSELDTFKKNIALFIFPIFTAFVLFLPIYNIYYAKAIFSLLSFILPNNILQNLLTLRSAIAIIFSLLYFIFIYIYLIVKNKLYYVNKDT